MDLQSSVLGEQVPALFKSFDLCVANTWSSKCDLIHIYRLCILTVIQAKCNYRGEEEECMLM